MAEAEPGPSKINTRNSGVSSDVDQNTQKHGSKSEHQKGATKARKNRGEKGNSVREKERVSDGTPGEQLKNRDDKKSVVETAETGNSIGEKELDVGKQVMSGGTSGEQILNPNDDDQSVDETSQMGNGVGETEGVSDGTLAEPIINRDDNKSVVETAVNSVGEKELDAVKQVIISGGASGEQIPNLNDDDQSLDETSQMANGVGETEGVSDGPLAEPIINRDDNKSIDETAVNSAGEKDSEAVKQVIMYDGASGEQIPNLNDDDQSVDETSQMGNGVSEPEGVSDGPLAEPIKNHDDNKSVDETAEKGNNSGAEEESDALKQVIMYDGTSGQHITNSDDDKSPDEMAEMANGLCEKTVEIEGDLVKQGITYDGESGEQTKNRDDDSIIIGENICESKANLDKAACKSMETEMKDREILFSDSDVENEMDEDTELTDIINNLDNQNSCRRDCQQVLCI